MPEQRRLHREDLEYALRTLGAIYHPKGEPSRLTIFEDYVFETLTELPANDERRFKFFMIQCANKIRRITRKRERVLTRKVRHASRN